MRVFISYSHKDRGFVKALSRALERFLIEIWLDDHQLLIGDSLQRRLASAIADVDFVILVISPNSITSSWVYHELQLALNRERTENNVRLLPLLLHGTQLPSELSDRVFADFRIREEMTKAFPRLLRTLGIHNMEIEAKSYGAQRAQIVEVCADVVGVFLNNPATVMSSMSYDMSSAPYDLTNVESTPYVKVGQNVNPETLLGRVGMTFGGIEQEVLAECDGIIERVLVEHRQPVEYKQVLFEIRRIK